MVYGCFDDVTLVGSGSVVSIDKCFFVAKELSHHDAGQRRSPPVFIVKRQGQLAGSLSLNLLSLFERKTCAAVVQLYRDN